jgi:hypothetical protein
MSQCRTPVLSKIIEDQVPAQNHVGRGGGGDQAVNVTGCIHRLIEEFLRAEIKLWNTAGPNSRVVGGRGGGGGTRL